MMSTGPDTMIPPGAEVCQGAINALRNTQNWVLLFVVLAGIWLFFGGLGLLFWTGMLVLAGGIRGLFVAFIFAIPILIQGLFAWLLFKYYSTIGEFVARPVQANLQRALEAQQQFWMASGIAVLVMIGLYVLMLVGSIVLGAAIFSAASSGRF